MSKETIVITKLNAAKAYKKASNESKALLEDLLGKENVNPLKAIERIQTLEDACEELGLDIDTIFPEDYDEYDRARKTLEIFAEALREGKSEKECFYYPYFYWGSGGGGFRFHGYDLVIVFTSVGARLRVDSPDKATYFGKQLLDVWKIYITGTK